MHSDRYDSQDIGMDEVLSALNHPTVLDSTLAGDVRRALDEECVNAGDEPVHRVRLDDQPMCLPDAPRQQLSHMQ